MNLPAGREPHPGASPHVGEAGAKPATGIPPGAPLRTPAVVLRPDHDVLVAKVLVHALTSVTAIDTMHREIQARLNEVHHGLVIDCSRLDRVSSEFLVHLAELRKTCDQLRLRIAVCGIHGALADAFEVSHLEAIVPVFPTLREAVAALGQFTDWERLGMECVADEQAKRLADRRGPAWPYRRIAATFTALLAVTFLGWRIWQAGTGDATYVSQTVWHLASPGTIEGEVRIVRGGDTSPDARCAIVAWPADLVRSNKAKIERDELFERNESRRRATITGPFFTQTDSQGSYRLLVRSPEYVTTEYYVLFVSPSGASPPALHPDDRAVLNRYFEGVDDLLTDVRCRLERCQVAVGKTTRSDCRFQ